MISLDRSTILAGAASALLVAAAPAAAEQPLDHLNARLQASGAKVRVAVAEYVTNANSRFVGRTIWFSDRGNKQLGAHFVPGDPRRGGRTSILHAIDGTELTGDTGDTGDATTAINAAMATWDAQNCSTIPVLPFNGSDGVVPVPGLGVVQDLLGFDDGSINPLVADIHHAGFLPAGFFEALVAGGGLSILGVTFTFVWDDGTIPTDIDSNGKLDVAFREIYYNDDFTWSVDNPPADPRHVDIETIALHESGHGLSQGHFGDIFVVPGSGRLRFSPKALMNAALFSLMRELTGSDAGGHCSIWARWPNS
jgi:hypothetical protein